MCDTRLKKKHHLEHFSVHAFVVQFCHKLERFFREWEGFFCKADGFSKVVEGLLLRMRKASFFMHIPYFFEQTSRLLSISLLVLRGYYLRAATIRRQRSFLWDIHDSWIGEEWVRQWQLLDAVSSTRSLSVLLSAVRMTHTTRTVLAIVWWPSSEIICTCVRVPCLLATATIRGRHLFRPRASDCAATIQERSLLEDGVYLKKYGTFLCLRA